MRAAEMGAYSEPLYHPDPIRGSCVRLLQLSVAITTMGCHLWTIVAHINPTRRPLHYNTSLNTFMTTTLHDEPLLPQLVQYHSAGSGLGKGDATQDLVLRVHDDGVRAVGMDRDPRGMI